MEPRYTVGDMIKFYTILHGTILRVELAEGKGIKWVYLVDNNHYWVDEHDIVGYYDDDSSLLPPMYLVRKLQRELVPL